MSEKSQKRDDDEQDQECREDPEAAPGEIAQKRDIGERQEGLAERKTERSDRQRPPARGDKPAGHGDAGYVASHPLAGEPQGKHHEGQRPKGRNQRHRKACHRESDNNDDPQIPHTKPVCQPSGDEHHCRRRHCAKGVDPAPPTVGQAKLTSDIAGENRYEKRLTETGGEGQQQTGKQPACV